MPLDTSGTKPARESFQWDVFLSYRRPDKGSVRELAETLRKLKLKVWWDEWEIPPGADFQAEIWKGLKNSWATAVCIGPSTVAGWQEREVKGAINEQVQLGKPVLPVFLPGIPDPDKVDLEFLGLNSRVVFERSVNEQPVVDRMIWGITGTNPNHAPPPPPPQEVDLAAEGLASQAITSIASWLKTNNATFFVGPSTAGIGPSLPLRNWEIAVRLLRDIHVIDDDQIKMLPSVDIAATLYGIAQTDPILEETFVNLIQSRS